MRWTMLAQPGEARLWRRFAAGVIGQRSSHLPISCESINSGDGGVIRKFLEIRISCSERSGSWFLLTAVSGMDAQSMVGCRNATGCFGSESYPQTLSATGKLTNSCANRAGGSSVFGNMSFQKLISSAFLKSSRELFQSHRPPEAGTPESQATTHSDCSSWHFNSKKPSFTAEEISRRLRSGFAPAVFRKFGGYRCEPFRS